MTFTANFDPDEYTPYSVRLMYQDPNDDVRALPEEKNYINVETRIYYGRTASYAREYIDDIKKIDENGMIPPTTFDIVPIKGDGSTVIDVFFDRVAVHLIAKDSFEDQEHFSEFKLNDRIQSHLYGYKCVVNSLSTDKINDEKEYTLIDFMYPDEPYKEVVLGFKDTEVEFLYNERTYKVDYVMSSADKGTIEPASEECKILTEQPSGATLTPAAGQTFLYWQEEDGTQLGSDLHVVPHNPWYDKYHPEGKLTLNNVASGIKFNGKAEDEESHVFDMKKVQAVFQSDFPVPPGPEPVPGGGGDIWNASLTGDDLMVAVLFLLGALALTGSIFTIRLIARKRK